MKHVMLDGTLVPADEARITVDDAGFLEGDGVFETVRVEGGRALFLDAHLERLERGATAVKIRVPYLGHVLRSQVATLLANDPTFAGGLFDRLYDEAELEQRLRDKFNDLLELQRAYQEGTLRPVLPDL